MSGSLRPFDDSRWPDQEGFGECFLCGRWVDPLDPKRGSYDEPPAGPELRIHIPCLNGRDSVGVSIMYHAALNEMSDRQFKLLPRA